MSDNDNLELKDVLEEYSNSSKDNKEENINLNLEDFNSIRISKEELDKTLEEVKLNAIVVNVTKEDLEKSKRNFKDVLKKAFLLKDYYLIIIEPTSLTIIAVNPEDFLKYFKAFKSKLINLNFIDLRGKINFKSSTALVFIEKGGYYFPYIYSLDKIEEVQNYVNSPIFMKNIIKIISSLKIPKCSPSYSSFIIGLLLGALSTLIALTFIF